MLQVSTRVESYLPFGGELVDTVRAARHPLEGTMHAAADRYRTPFARGVVQAILKAQESIDLTALEQLVKRASVGMVGNYVQEALAVLGMELDQMEAMYLNIQFLSAKTTVLPRSKKAVRLAADKPAVTISFNKTNQEALEWASKQSAKLVVDVTKDTQRAIRKAIARGFQEGYPPREMAQTLKGFIGLTSKQMDTLQNRKKQRIKKGMTSAKAHTLLQKETKKKISERAMTIARTETIAASSEGQRQLWKAAMEQGHLPFMVREWQYVQLKSYCPICGPLDGLQATVDGMFEGPKGPIPGPPAHPRCRCTVALVDAEKDFSLAMKEDIPDSDDVWESYTQEHSSKVVSDNIKYQATAKIEDAHADLMKRFGKLKDLDPVTTKVYSSKFLPTWKKGVTGKYQIAYENIEIAAGHKLNSVATMDDLLYVGIDPKTSRPVWSVTGDNVKAIYRHEYGHHVYNKLVKSNAYVLEELEDIATAYGPSISKYAGTESYEFFAETFAAWTHPKYKLGMMPEFVEEFMGQLVGKPVGMTALSDDALSALNALKQGAVKVPPPSTATAKYTQAWTDDLLKNQVSGQKGSNAGGLYKTSEGEEYYVKFYKDSRQTYNEVVANRIYSDLAMDSVPESAALVTSKNEVVFASKIVKNQGTLGNIGLNKERAEKVLDSFVADVFTRNWDAVGTGLDNVVLSEAGKMIRIDQGGALLFRAQGALKPIQGAGVIDEWVTLQTKNAYYNQVFQSAGVANANEIKGVTSQLERVFQLEAKWASRGGWKAYVDDALKSVPDSAEKKYVVDNVATMLELRAQQLKYTHQMLLKNAVKTTQPAITSPSPVTVVEPKGPVGPALTKKQADKAKWTDNDIKWMKKMYAEGEGISKIADHFEGSYTGVMNIVKGKFKKDIVGPPIGPKPPKGGSGLLGKTTQTPAPVAPVVQPAAQPVKSNWDPYKDQFAQVKKPVTPIVPKPTTAPPPVAAQKTISYDQYKNFSYYMKQKYKKQGYTVVGGPAKKKSKYVSSYSQQAKSTYAPASGSAAEARRAYEAWVLDLRRTDPKAYTALQEYTGSLYVYMNKYLQGRGNTQVFGTPAVKDGITHIERALKNAPKPPPPSLVYRGIEATPEEVFGMGITQGAEVQLLGFQSTSVSPNAAFGGKIRLEIVPKRGAYLEELSFHKSEKEFLLPHGETYRVISIDRTGYQTKVRLEML